MLLAAVLGVLVASVARIGAERPLHWRSLPSEPGGVPSILALDPVLGLLASGSERGARLWTGDDSREVLRQERVRDLAFSGRELLIGTQGGLFEHGPAGLRRISLGPSAAAREVRDLAGMGDVVAVATPAGLRVRLSPDAPWQSVPLPTVGAELVAVLPQPSGVARIAVWAAGSLWWLPAQLPLEPQRATRPRIAGEAPPVALGPAGEGRLLIVHTDALAVERVDDWALLRPSLPPGARLRRHARALGRHWLATDAGLLVSDALEGPWRRATGSLGNRAVVDLAGDGHNLWVATERGLQAAREAVDQVLPQLPDARPPIAAVQRMVLRHQSLTVRVPEQLRQGVARRGWLPVVSLHGGYEQERSRGKDRDQAFLSGETRLLHDRDDDRESGFDVGIALSWDLGDLAYHPESIDVSREARALVALRDDVLDEVNQLYFERLRALGKLRALPDDAPERPELEARIAEHTAGLDAWTGGEFSAEARAP